MTNESNELTVFESLLRSAGDLAGVFEHDGDAGYFYLYNAQRPQDTKVVDALRVVSGRLKPDNARVEIRWDAAENVVALFIESQLWAVFDPTTGAGYTGDYGAGIAPELPPRIAAIFASRSSRHRGG